MSIQLIVLFVSLVLMSVIAAIFIGAVRAAKDSRAAVPSEAVRSRLIKGMLLFGVVLTVSSLLPWPHAVGSESGVHGQRDGWHVVLADRPGFRAAGCASGVPRPHC